MKTTKETLSKMIDDLFSKDYEIESHPDGEKFKIIIGHSSFSYFNTHIHYKYDDNREPVIVQIIGHCNFITHKEASELLMKIEAFCLDEFTISHRLVAKSIKRFIEKTIEVTRPEIEKIKDEFSLKEKDYHEKIKQLESKIEESLSEIKYFETQEGNYLVNIDEEIFFYLSKFGQILRHLPNEEGQDEWEWASQEWDRDYCLGFPDIIVNVSNDYTQKNI